MLFLILGIPIALTMICFFAFRKKSNKVDFLLKTLAILYLLVILCRYFFADSFIYIINKGFFDNYYYEVTDIKQSILRWGQYTSYGVLVIAAFYKSRLFNNIAIYFCLIFSVLSAFYFNDFMEYFMADNPRGIVADLWFRQTLFAAELILAILIPLLITFVKKHYFNVRNLKEWLSFFITLPFILLSLIPVYLPQSLVGYTSIDVNRFTLGNIIWFVLVLLTTYILYIILKNKTQEQKHMVCTYLAIALFIHYNSLFLMGFQFRRIPLQLCNLGTYFILLSLLIKKPAFFNFVFIGNVTGTLIAMTVPDISNGIGSFWNYHFILEHTQVFIIPMLMMLLGIYPRLTKKAIKHTFIGFSIYFIFCALIGAFLNAYAYKFNQNQVNFFYIFDTEFVTQMIPALNFTTKISIKTFRGYVIYPLFMLLFYSIFSILCIAFYMFMKKLYLILDDNNRLRLARIKLFNDLSLNKRKGDLHAKSN